MASSIASRVTPPAPREQELIPVRCAELVGDHGAGHAWFMNEDGVQVWPVTYRRRGSSFLIRVPAGVYQGASLHDLVLHTTGPDPAGLWSVWVGGQGRDVTDALEILGHQIGGLGRGTTPPDRGSVIELVPRSWSGRLYPGRL